MPSTYSTSLGLELMGAGDQAGNWGNTTNTNLGSLIEQAITGVENINMLDATTTLVTGTGTLGTQSARNAVLLLGSALTANRNLVVPSVNKFYAVRNGTSGGYSVVVKTSAGSGVTLANGLTQLMYCDGTNVVAATQPFDSVNGNLFLSGNVTINKANPSIALTKTATTGQTNTITGQANGLPRWEVILGDGENEAGSNAGSNLLIKNSNDAGTIIETPLAINRSTGTTTLKTLSVTNETSVGGQFSVTSSSSFNGNIAVSKADPVIVLSKNAASGQTNTIAGQTSGLVRWNVVLGDAANEAGSNAGSDFSIYNFTDAQAYIETPLTITRANGTTTLKALSVINSATVSGDISTGGQNIRVGSGEANSKNFTLQNSSRSVSFYLDTSSIAGLADNTGSTTRFYTDTSGNLFVIGTVTDGVSDARLKTDISPILNAVEKVCKINGVTFLMNELADGLGVGNASRQVGVLAHEVEAVLPEAISLAPFDTKHEDGVAVSKSGENYKTVQYEKIVPLLIEAIKELSLKVSDLEKKSS